LTQDEDKHAFSLNSRFKQAPENDITAVVDQQALTAWNYVGVPQNFLRELL